jgi:hypothetical protein
MKYPLIYHLVCFAIILSDSFACAGFLRSTVEKATIDHIVDGYTDKQSYFPGDTVKVYINANGYFVNKTIYLYSIDGIPKDNIVTHLAPQSMSVINPVIDYGYSVTFRYVIPYHLPSGMYNLGNKIFFIVKNGNKDGDITIVYPTNTEAAYNDAGGKSLYNIFSTNNQRASKVSFQRPLSNFILNEIQLHSRPFLEWLQILTEYSIQYICDADMDDYDEIKNSMLLVVIGHSEYWSRRARVNFDRFVEEGRNAAVFSGNTMWWQVRYESDQDLLVCYKDANLDPENDSLLKTIPWPRSSLDYSVMQSIGCDWPHGAYGMKVNHGNYGYKITRPNSPILEGTHLEFHSVLSCQSYEYDATLLSGTDLFGDPTIDEEALGFCQIELIGYDKGDRVEQPTGHGWGTFVVMQKKLDSGTIVNTAFNAFTGKTPTYGSGGICGVDSVIIRKIVVNIFDKTLGKKSLFEYPSAECIDPNSTLVEPGSKEICPEFYPNPTSGILKIQHHHSATEELDIELYTLAGICVKKRNIRIPDTSEVDLGDLRDGTYFLFVRHKGELIHQSKIVILH